MPSFYGNNKRSFERGGGSQLGSKEIAGWIFHFLLDGGQNAICMQLFKGGLVIEPLGIRLLLLRYSMLMHARQENPLAHKRAPWLVDGAEAMA